MFGLLNRLKHIYRMKKISFIILICIHSFFLKGQKGFDPNIIFLVPEKVELSEEIEEEIKLLEKKWIYKEKDFLLDNFDSLKNNIVKNDSILDNFKTHYLNQLEFSYNLNFTNFIIKEYASSFQTTGMPLVKQLMLDVASFRRKRYTKQDIAKVYAKHTGSKILSSRSVSVHGKRILGCIDYGLALCTALRAKGVPAKFVRIASRCSSS